MINTKLLKIFCRSMGQKHCSSFGLTKCEFENGIKKIIMSDQKTRNSLSTNMMKELLHHIKSDVQNQQLRVIIVSAKGSIFSAGHNLKELTPEAGKEQHRTVFKLASDLMFSIIDCPVPVIAQVDGLAAAAGCQLVAQCDIGICTDVSQFSTPGVNFGIFCSTPGIPLARKVQNSVALNMLLTGQPISAIEAKFSGLITKVCAPDNIEHEVQKTCDAIMMKSRSIIELGKKFYYKQVDMDLRKAYELGAMKMVDNLGMVDGKEGISSFVQKRRPVWKHQDN